MVIKLSLLRLFFISFRKNIGRKLKKKQLYLFFLNFVWAICYNVSWDLIIQLDDGFKIRDF